MTLTDGAPVLPTSEITIVGPLTFHDLALIIAGASTIVAITMSFFLIFQHALHYTKPREQKQYVVHPPCWTRRWTQIVVPCKSGSGF